jgi:hypothetical protein
MTLTDAAVRTPLWATPAANLHNYDENPESFFARRERLKEKGINGNGAGVPLGQQSQLWATTTSRDWKDGSCAGANVTANALLGRQVVLWSTPRAEERQQHNSRDRNVALSKQVTTHHTNSLRSLKTEKGGRGIYNGGPVLNPRFAETLMGWPTGWTDSGSPETVSSPSKPPLPSAPSGGGFSVVDIQNDVTYKEVQPAEPEEHMPRGVRGSKKPSISRRSRKPAEEPKQEAQQPNDDLGMSAADLVAEHLRVISTSHLANIVTILNTRLEEIVNLLGERNELAKKLDAPADNSVLDGFVARIAALESKLDQPAAVAAITEPAKRERKPKVVETAPAAAPAAEAKPAPKTEIVHCKHIGTLERIRPNLDRCTTCGAVLDVVEQATAPVTVEKAAPAPVPAAQAVVETKPAPAAPAAPATNGKAAPSVDDVRAVAITFAGKHGKPKLSDMLKEFGASNLSTVPEESRAALMAKLQAGL